MRLWYNKLSKKEITMENKDKIVNLGIFAIILLIANWLSDVLILRKD